MRTRGLFFLSSLLVFALIFGACVAPGIVPADSGATDSAAAEPAAASPGEPTELVVSTWGYNQDLIDKNLTLPFEEMYNVKIVYETGNNAERLTKLVARGDSPNVDVVHFAGPFTFEASQQGMLQPIDTSLLTNYNELYDWAKDPLGNGEGISYAISAYPLIYRTDKIDPPITSWADLFREDVKGFVTVPDLATTNGPATIVMLATAFGGDIDNTEPAWEQLPALADQLVTTYRRSSELTTLIQQEEAWVAPYSSFSIGQLLETGLPLAMVIPAEGLPAAPSVVSIVKGTKNLDLAHKYIDFIISQQVQSAMAEDLVDSPTNAAVTVSDAVAPLLTYGKEMLDSLIFLDQEKLNSYQEEWLARWNEVMLQ
jgi:putative spermidine/putrescine transport system substrate-binding protein